MPRQCHSTLKPMREAGHSSTDHQHSPQKARSQSVQGQEISDVNPRKDIRVGMSSRIRAGSNCFEMLLVEQLSSFSLSCWA